MNQDNNNMMKSHRSDSQDTIDLIDILIQLKNGKFTIIAFVIIAVIIAGIYVFTVKEKWTSNAIVTYPDSGQIASYTNAMGVLYSQTGNAPNTFDVQQRFFGRFNSAISALAEQLDNQQVPETLSITSANKDQAIPLRISYTAYSAADAQKTLTTYIQQINKRVVTELNDDLQTSIDSTLGELKESLANKEKIAQEKKDERLQVLNQALLTAEQSNVKTPIVQQAESLSEDTLFVLGSTALSSMIKNEATRPLPLDDSYFNTRQLLLSVTALKTVTPTTYSLRYVMKPDLQIRGSGPKKVISLILGALLGLIVGSTVVLTRNKIKNYKA
ncbi:LPS O-antigen chain length determinant protein WzzB [Ewingella americana]|uniref:Chain length determinant protein n=2 Tax=Ewingella americana TaxID=41202 RepID=A0A085GHC9_EWIA3|nr:LPS O-antigen chain length determinant protein WzzB [Ewingella americana]KAA8729511.1 LPS O-antigen chain length determinant protein WzzB [Ewingella americana]KFC83124.1 O-antigen lipopolysaccharide chain length regulator [Ewingella americana ATCC 33852]STQ44994.1 Polysaccharide antigen chain regulator [Ewingella americana]